MLHDSPKGWIAEAVRELKDPGVAVKVVTGDNRHVAELPRQNSGSIEEASEVGSRSPWDKIFQILLTFPIGCDTLKLVMVREGPSTLPAMLALPCETA